MINIRFRQSLIKTWVRCPLQAKFRDLDGLPGIQGSKATFGVCIHHALEQYSRTGDVDQATRAFIEVWDDPGLLGVAIEHWNKYTTAGGLREKGLQILRAYDEKQRLTPRQIVFVEHPFLVPFGEHELTGTVDLGCIRENHHSKQILTIEDWKTNAKKPSRTELIVDPQFTTYIWASLQKEFWFGNEAEGFPPVPNAEWWWEMLQQTPRRGVWIQLWDNCSDIDAGDRDQQEFERLYRVCCEIERAIEHQVFVPNLSGESCLFCDYSNDPCPTRIPTAEEWANRFEADANSWL